MRHILLILVSCCFLSCSNNSVVELQFQKDLIPEGIAIDAETESLFLNSLRLNKIVKSGLDGSHPEDFISTGEYGYLRGFGMLLKDSVLYALGNNSTKNNQSVLLLLNKRNGELIKSYFLNDTTFIYLNDMAVKSSGEIYITDSENDKIYTVDKTNDSIIDFIHSDEIARSNGICISDNDRYLYLASGRKGIRVYDLKTNKIVNEQNNYVGIDGLKYYKGNLYGIVNGAGSVELNGLFRYRLNENETEIVDAEKLMGYDERFDIPTTLAIYNGYLYFNLNSQMGNLNGNTNEIVDKSKLKPYMLYKYRLD